MKKPKKPTPYVAPFLVIVRKDMPGVDLHECSTLESARLVIKKENAGAIYSLEADFSDLPRRRR